MLIGTLSIGYDFIDTLEVPLLAGRNYSRDFALDALPDVHGLAEGEMGQGNILVNESALGRLGLGTPSQALGREISMSLRGGDESRGTAVFTVVGVVADMHFQSLKTLKRPEVYLMKSSRSDNSRLNPSGNMLVRYRGDPTAISAAIERVWNDMIPDVPLEYAFADEVAAEEFTRELNTAKMLGLFSSLAIIIACLGLYGLASFTAERRTREIGIRKVLGARVSTIVRLLLWQFSKPVLLANLLAWPIAAWGMVTWLENFPYRLDSWVLAPLCLMAGLLALSISWLTVGGNAARVARRNPIQALRYE